MLLSFHLQAQGMQYSLTSVLYCAFKILIFRLLPNVNFTSREACNSHSDRFGGRVGLQWPSEIPPWSQSSGGGSGGCIANQQEFREPDSSLLVPQATRCGRQGTGHSRYSLLRKLKVWVGAGDQVFERLLHYNDLDIAIFFSVNEQHTVK